MPSYLLNQALKVIVDIDMQDVVPCRLLPSFHRPTRQGSCSGNDFMDEEISSASSTDINSLYYRLCGDIEEVTIKAPNAKHNSPKVEIIVSLTFMDHTMKTCLRHILEVSSYSCRKN